MSRKSLNRFEVVNNCIHISREGWEKLAFATYREDYYDELASVTWTSDKGYLKNNQHGLLHRYIMAKWYGDEMLDEMTQKGWIVDHMNNDGYDCRISNLEFLSKRHNTAKGQTVDVEAKALQYNIALNIFKDFTTGHYQITIAFNDNIDLYDKSSDSFQPLNGVNLLYDCDYRTVVWDAEHILLEYEEKRIINPNKLRHVAIKHLIPPDIKCTKKEIDEIMAGERAFVERDGKMYLIMNTGRTFVSSQHFIEGWTPDKKI